MYRFRHAGLPRAKRWLVSQFRLTRRQYYADFFITPPITIVLLAISMLAATWVWVPEYLVGIMAWTLYEYLVHRFVSHKVWGIADAHWLHHASPTEFVAVPPTATIAIYFAMWIFFGLQSTAIAVGFATGYVAYSALHTIFHYTSWRVASRLRHHHALHHRFHNVNFGVSSQTWDWVFGTYRRTPR